MADAGGCRRSCYDAEQRCEQYPFNSAQAVKRPQGPDDRLGEFKPVLGLRARAEIKRSDPVEAIDNYPFD